MTKRTCYSCKHKGIGIKGCKHPKVKEQHQFKKNPCPYWEKENKK